LTPFLHDFSLGFQHQAHVEMVMDAPDLADGEPFPINYLETLQTLWNDPGILKAIERGNEAALPEK
jgi:guanine nucleotide-binding protein subunit alpha, other